MSVKSIRFNGVIVSSGIVNFEGSDNRYVGDKIPSIIRETMCNSGRGGFTIKNYKNIKYAKHAVKKIGTTEDGKNIYDLILKISKDCLRQGIFSDEQPSHNPGIVYSEIIFNKFLSSKSGLLRGYFFANKGIKRKSSVYVSDAIQSSDNISTVDVGTMNAHKDSKADKDAEGSLALHYKETISGLTKYEFEGSIDLSELQFISISEDYDRKAIDPNYLDFYVTELEKVVGGKVKKGYFIKNTATNGLPEEGILLDSDQVKVLVKYFFERIIDLEIVRGASGRAWLDSIEIMVKENGLINGEYKKVTSVNDVMNSISDVHCFYNYFNEDKAKRLYDEINIGNKKNLDGKKSKKEGKKAQSAKTALPDTETTKEDTETTKEDTEEKIVE
jgi:hypothetical protein